MFFITVQFESMDAGSFWVKKKLSRGCLTRDSSPAYQLDNGKEVFPEGRPSCWEMLHTNLDRFSDMVHEAHNRHQQEN